MEIFFNFLRKILIVSTMAVFLLAVTYIPHEQNTVYEAGAQEIVFDPTNYAANQSTAISTGIAAGGIQSLVAKEYVEDPIVWALVTVVMELMLREMVDWINSGFEDGRPTFVQDIAEYLREVADGVAGEYIEQLGGLGSYLCDPFKLDIQVALGLEYERERLHQPAPTCTLTDVIDNMEGFIQGGPGSFFEGGWDDWFDMTAQPDVYTPYGAFLTAQEGLYRNILEAEQKEAKLVDYGSGFLSMKDCQEDATGPDTTKTSCTVSTPGKIIQEALSFNLDTGRQNLVEADEWSEVVGALLISLVNGVFTQGGSLLGS